MQISEQLVPLLKKYAPYMTHAKMSVESLISLGPVEIKQLMEFNADGFYKMYIADEKTFEYPNSAQRYESFLSIIFNADILRTNRLNEALTEFVRILSARVSEDQFYIATDNLKNNITKPQFKPYELEQSESASQFR